MVAAATSSLSYTAQEASRGDQHLGDSLQVCAAPHGLARSNSVNHLKNLDSGRLLAAMHLHIHQSQSNRHRLPQMMGYQCCHYGDLLPCSTPGWAPEFAEPPACPPQMSPQSASELATNAAAEAS